MLAIFAVALRRAVAVAGGLRGAALGAAAVLGAASRSSRSVRPASRSICSSATCCRSRSSRCVVRGSFRMDPRIVALRHARAAQHRSADRVQGDRIRSPGGNCDADAVLQPPKCYRIRPPRFDLQIERPTGRHLTMSIQPSQPQSIGGVLDTTFQLYKASIVETDPAVAAHGDRGQPAVHLHLHAGRRRQSCRSARDAQHDGQLGILAVSARSA